MDGNREKLHIGTQRAKLVFGHVILGIITGNKAMFFRVLECTLLNDIVAHSGKYIIRVDEWRQGEWCCGFTE